MQLLCESLWVDVQIGARSQGYGSFVIIIFAARMNGFSEKQATGLIFFIVWVC
jgi:hypothetical protein